MSLLETLNRIANEMRLPAETAVFKQRPENSYLVFTPLEYDLDLFADNRPEMEIESVRVSLFSKQNYLSLVRELTERLLARGITVTERRYVELEPDTGYHHVAITCELEHTWR